MTEVKLKDSDYQQIYEFALKNYINNAAPYRKTETSKEHFLVRCILEAFMVFLNSKGYTSIEGKVYSSSD